MRNRPSLMALIAALFVPCLFAANAQTPPMPEALLKQLRNKISAAQNTAVQISGKVNYDGMTSRYTVSTTTPSCVQFTAGLQERTAKGPRAFSDWTPGDLTPEEVHALVFSGAPIPGKSTAISKKTVESIEGNWVLTLHYNKSPYTIPVVHVLTLDAQYRVKKTELKTADGSRVIWEFTNADFQTLGNLSVPTTTSGYFTFADKGARTLSIEWQTVSMLGENKKSELTKACQEAAGKK